MLSHRDIFARTIISLEPYAADIVLIGGWLHELYIRDAGSTRLPIRTDDIDFTIPRVLSRQGRPALLDLVGNAGFKIDVFGQADEAIRLVQKIQSDYVDLDLITEGDPQSQVTIEGQPNLRAQAYPNQNILLENARWINIGPEFHDRLNPKRSVRIPVISAYVLHKGESSGRRQITHKKAKDLVYLFEILQDPILGPEALAGLPGLAARYPEVYEAWHTNLEQAAANVTLRQDMADQLQFASTADIGTRSEIIQNIAARFRRAIAESDG